MLFKERLFMRYLPLVFVIVFAMLLSALSTFAEGEWKTFNLGTPIYSLRDENDYIWVGTIQSLIKMNKKTGDTEVYNPSITYFLPWDIKIDDKGNKWIVTQGGGVAKFKGGDWSVYDTSNSDLPSNFAYTVKIDDKGGKWFGTTEGLAKFDGENWTVFDTSNSDIPGNRIFAIEIDEEGKKWIGTNNGVAVYDDNDWTVYNTSNSDLPYNIIATIAIDNQSGKWLGFGNKGRGAAKFDGESWAIYDASNCGLPDNDIHKIKIDSLNNKWFATWGGGVAKLDGDNWRVYNPYNSDLPSYEITAIEVDNESGKWFGTESGALAVLRSGVSVERKIDAKKSVLSAYPNPAKNFVNFRIVWDKKYDIDELSIKIYDIFGSELKNPNISYESESINEAVFKWNTAGVGEGLYIMQLKIDDYSKARKVIVY